MATLFSDFRLRSIGLALVLALATTSCVSFKHKTFPELARFSSNEVEVVRIPGSMVTAGTLFSGKSIKGVKGVEIIDCSSHASVAECSRLLPSRVGEKLIEVIDDADTVRIYGNPCPDGKIENVIIATQESPASMQLIVLSGKIDVSENLNDLVPTQKK